MPGHSTAGKCGGLDPGAGTEPRPFQSQHNGTNWGMDGAWARPGEGMGEFWGPGDMSDTWGVQGECPERQPGGDGGSLGLCCRDGDRDRSRDGD